MALSEGQRQAGEQSDLRPQKGHLFKVVFLLMGLLGVLAVWLCFGDQGLVRLYQTEAERQACGDRIRFLAQENQALMDEIRRLRTDMQYVEWVARKELNLVKENEMVFRFKERLTGSQSRRDPCAFPGGGI